MADDQTDATTPGNRAAPGASPDRSTFFSCGSRSPCAFGASLRRFKNAKTDSGDEADLLRQRLESQVHAIRRAFESNLKVEPPPTEDEAFQRARRPRRHSQRGISDLCFAPVLRHTATHRW